jgi:hypothetical protein
MISQAIDIESIDQQIGKKVERYRRRYKITYADLAWILLRIGTSYYFKDICTRGTNGCQEIITE